jgi:N-methylhydantoinase A
MTRSGSRLAVDVGGTFTDIALETSGAITTTKTPTTSGDPVEAVITGIRLTLERAALSPAEVFTVIHGTTLATNALIERKGARVGVVTTQGFRDILEIAYERRYDQYDIFVDKPDMLVPRERCYTVAERIDADGEVLTALDEATVETLAEDLARDEVESLAVGLLHSYANDEHERRVRELLRQRLPGLWISLSSEVSPEIREYDRLCTTLANAYIEPMMAGYLGDLEARLRADGLACPLFIMTSGGGMTTLHTAVRFPIRLVESGPSGGAILAATVARSCGLDRVVSFDMGGTTAKVCLIDDGAPQSSRHFEIARASRFIKGSGLPVRIPVTEMIEIGAGGGSIATVDSLGRIAVGPESAAAEPGPACYKRGGTRATVTDADAVIGYLDPETFAEGRLPLDLECAGSAVAQDVAEPLALSVAAGADGISQIVDENMANAARVHAVERGKDLAQRTMIAFGGNGPLHAARVAEKTGVSRIIVPPDPGVGSAIGFLNAPVSYEIVRSHYTLFDRFDVEGVNALLCDMEREARQIVSPGAAGQALTVRRTGFMRYRGQGHEIEVSLPEGPIDEPTLEALRAGYERVYARLFSRVVPGMRIEVMNWAVVVATQAPAPPPVAPSPEVRLATADGRRALYFGRLGERRDVSCYRRERLRPGDRIEGPALIVEAQTTSYVAPGFDAAIDGAGNIVMTRRPDGSSGAGGMSHGQT